MAPPLRKFLAVLLMIALSMQAAWAAVPACDPPAAGAHAVMASQDSHAAAEVKAAAQAEDCDRMMVRCAAALPPAHLPDLPASVVAQRFPPAPAPHFLFLTDGPDRPPRPAFA